MITKDQFINKLGIFVKEYLDKVASNNPMIAFTKPIISKIVYNKLGELNGFLGLIAEKDGTIDAQSLIGDMIVSLTNTNTFSLPTPVFGDVLIGNGRIEIGIPYINKGLVFNTSDLEYLKELLTSERYG